MVCTVGHEVWKTGRLFVLAFLCSIRGLLGAVFASLTVCTSPEHVDGFKPAYSREGAATKPANTGEKNGGKYCRVASLVGKFGSVWTSIICSSSFTHTHRHTREWRQLLVPEKTETLQLTIAVA